jgi:hypothetical protein
MRNNGHSPLKSPNERTSPRVYSVREITISYEGQNEEILVKPPNLSRRGMFISTSRSFPEGAVLNLRFALALTGAEIRSRCEVRYCRAGVGIGVEFIGLSGEFAEMIEKEIALSAGAKRAVRHRKTEALQKRSKSKRRRPVYRS